MNPGPPRHQADILPIELSWLGSNKISRFQCIKCLILILNKLDRLNSPRHISAWTVWSILIHFIIKIINELFTETHDLTLLIMHIETGGSQMKMTWGWGHELITHKLPQYFFYKFKFFTIEMLSQAQIDAHWKFIEWKEESYTSAPPQQKSNHQSFKISWFCKKMQVYLHIQ